MWKQKSSLLMKVKTRKEVTRVWEGGCGGGKDGERMVTG
jgi:hypothetical protein